MRVHSLLAVFLLGVFIAACSILPKTPAQPLAYADASFTALVETAADLRDQGALTPGQAERLGEYINRGNDVLSHAWASLGQGDDEQALQYARVINSLLILIRSELEGRS